MLLHPLEILSQHPLLMTSVLGGVRGEARSGWKQSLVAGSLDYASRQLLQDWSEDFRSVTSKQDIADKHLGSSTSTCRPAQASKGPSTPPY